MIKIQESSKHILKEKELDKPIISKTAIKTKYGVTLSNRTIADRLAGYPNIDVENTQFKEVDPYSLKKSDDILFVFRLDYEDSNYTGGGKFVREQKTSYNFCLWMDGKKVDADSLIDYESYLTHDGDKVPLGNKALINASFKFLVQYCYKAYLLDIQTNKDIKQQRKEDKSGSIDRVDSDRFYYGVGNVDKSGYIFDKDKYRKMLAATNKEAYLKYFNDALDLYNRINELFSKNKKSRMSLQEPEEGEKSISYSDTKQLNSFIQVIESYLESFAWAFRKNDKNNIQMYAKFIKDSILKNKDNIDTILKKYE